MVKKMVMTTMAILIVGSFSPEERKLWLWEDRDGLVWFGFDWIWIWDLDLDLGFGMKN